MHFKHTARRVQSTRRCLLNTTSARQCEQRVRKFKMWVGNRLFIKIFRLKKRFFPQGTKWCILPEISQNGRKSKKIFSAQNFFGNVLGQNKMFQRKKISENFFSPGSPLVVKAEFKQGSDPKRVGPWWKKIPNFFFTKTTYFDLKRSQKFFEKK